MTLIERTASAARFQIRVASDAASSAPDGPARMVIKAESSGLSFYEKLSRSDSIKGYLIGTHKIAILKAYSLQKSLNLWTPLLSRCELAETHIIRTPASPQKYT